MAIRIQAVKLSVAALLVRVLSLKLAPGLEIILGFATASDLVGVQKSENSDDPEKFFREVVYLRRYNRQLDR